MTVMDLIPRLSNGMGTLNVDSVWPIAVSSENPEVERRDSGKVIT
jgi:hypothetical protein